jgi:murein DD-endopeptidase MepM/ murein hydrolase activator NlpD
VPRILSALGEMRGVAGIRSAHARPEQAPASERGLRFELTRAAGVAGQRALADWCQRREGVIGPGEVFSQALLRTGLELAQAGGLVDALKDLMNFRQCRAGERFELWLAPGGRLQRFVYHKSPELAYRVERGKAGLAGQRLVRQPETSLEEVGVLIQGSLYASLEAAGETPALVAELVDIFAWDIDFYVDTRAGDTVRLLVEKRSLDGAFIGYGRVLAAEYHGQAVGARRAFRHTLRDDKVGFYDPQGASLRKAFLKSPLKFARITSGFGNRVHPILGFSRMHRGIDYGAPRGTPVWAMADGTVLHAGWKGGYGNTVVLRHANGYQTLYGHLHSLKVKAGARVQQKQEIGTVGSTGLSTGPHLHFEMLLRGQHLNPVKQRFPAADPVPGGELPEYLRQIQPLTERLLGIRVPGQGPVGDLARSGDKGAG